MNTTTLNMTTLDGGVIIKRGGGGTSPDTPSKPKWTGHADAEGLKAIGWTDEDIAYYQENGVNWNEEDDQWHKVTDDNKALYGVLTAANISTYKDRIVYLPKIDTSGVTSMYSMFNSCRSLTSIPLLDTSNVTNMGSMFFYCDSLVAIPQLDTSKVKNISYMFKSCFSLTSIPMLDTSNATNMSNMFSDCCSLTAIPLLDTSKVTNMSSMFYNCRTLVTIPQLDTSKVTDMSNMFSGCYSLVTIPQLDTSKLNSNRSMFAQCSSLKKGIEFTSTTITQSGGVYSSCSALNAAPFLNKIGETSYHNSDFNDCYSLQFAQIYGAKLLVPLNNSPLLSKDSLLYLINNEAATSAITIKLASYAYDRWVTDPDIVAALANHPNISISK